MGQPLLQRQQGPTQRGLSGGKSLGATHGAVDGWVGWLEAGAGAGAAL
jgi:hypothetical protein